MEEEKKIIKKIVRKKVKKDLTLWKEGRYSFILIRDNRESIWQGFFSIFFLFLIIPYIGFPDKYENYYYWMLVLFFLIFMFRIRKIYYKKIEEYRSNKKAQREDKK